jgi:hypothetical protein
MLQIGITNAGGAAVKKLPIIGLLIGAVAALYLKMKGKKEEPEPELMGGGDPAPSEDTSPPA